MRIAVVSTQRRRLRPGWASDLAAAISRRTQRDEERDAMVRLARAMSVTAPYFFSLAGAFDAAAKVLDRFGSARRAP